MSTTDEIKVWDPLVRVFHWTLASGFAIAYLSEDDLLGLHVWAGYTVLGLVAVRLLWGLIGTRYARFTDFVYRPATVLAYLQDIAAFRAKRYLGHNPAGGYMVLALLVMLPLTGLSGLATYGVKEFAGPLLPWVGGLDPWWGEVFEGLHEALANTTLALVVVHVAGVLLANFQHRENLVRAMFTGRKPANPHGHPHAEP